MRSDLPDFNVSKHGYFYDLGAKLLDQGYTVLPIGPGTKWPYDGEDGVGSWQKVKTTHRLIDKWIDMGMGHGGVGINTLNTPAVDLDISDDTACSHMQAWIEENIAEAPVRFGKRPRRLMVFRTSKPFRKLMSGKYEDEWGDEQKIEILCDGQQFVAYHIHPETQAPYTWQDQDFCPIKTPQDDLPELDVTKAKRIIAEFDRYAREQGWKIIKESRYQPTEDDGFDDEDAFSSDVEKINMESDELMRRLMAIPDSDDYDQWFQVGMALYHQFDGDYEGLDMWREWSMSSDKYEEGECEKKWKSFDISNKSRRPVTARYILELAKEAAETLSEERKMELRDMFAQAKSIPDWQAAAKKARRAELAPIDREALVALAKTHYDMLAGTKIGIQAVRKELAYEMEVGDMPKWCKNWVFDTSDDAFFNIKTKICVTKTGFDALYDRHSLTRKDINDGRSTPSNKASDLALNVYQIPAVHGRMYAPGEDAVFFYDGLRTANEYPENQVPKVPDRLRPTDKKNIQRVRNHVAHLLPDEREQELLMSWLAYVVQNPGKRVNWAVLLQGTEGDGKSFFLFLLRAVMGIPNVAMLNASSFKGDFTGWAVGQCVAGVEELRLQGENRYEVLNKIKPFITNDVVEVHAKYRGQYSAVNTTNYFCLTNYRDAMPLNENDRRYFVLFSQWQNKEKLGKFKDANPDYYENLYGALTESAGALRKWLLNYELTKEFNPRGDAPATEAHRMMVQAAMPQELQIINQLIETNAYPEISNELLNISSLNSEFNDYGITVQAKNWKITLERAGFYPLAGSLMISGVRMTLYSKCPEKFTLDQTATGKVNAVAVRRFLEQRKKSLEDDDL